MVTKKAMNNKQILALLGSVGLILMLVLLSYGFLIWGLLAFFFHNIFAAYFLLFLGGAALALVLLKKI